MNNKNNTFLTVILPIIIVAFFFIMGYISSNSGSSSSSYNLHNKDGSINWQYYNDMQDYFEKHPEKNPAGK